MPDLPARIKALAEKEVLGEPYCPGHEAEGGAVACGGCERGRIVPFKELRKTLGHQHCQFKGFCVNGYLGLRHGNPQHDCEGRGWVPEPNVEKACWRVWIALPHPVRRRLTIEQPKDWGKAVISAAEVWAQEQQKEAQRG